MKISLKKKAVEHKKRLSHKKVWHPFSLSEARFAKQILFLSVHQINRKIQIACKGNPE